MRPGRLLLAVALAAGVVAAAPAAADAATGSRIFAWGLGPLGDGSSRSQTNPKAIDSLAGSRSIGCGDYACYAVTARRTVRAWGYNFDGLLGNGRSSNTTRLRPGAVSGLTDVEQVAGTSDSGYALKRDGTVWAWGGNSYGQLGIGSTTRKLTPVKVHRLSHVVAIATARGGGDGLDAVFAIKSNGTLWAWGDNETGQLGDGTRHDRSLPVQVTFVSRYRVRAVAATDAWGVYAVTGAGNVYAWGNWQHPRVHGKVAGLSGVTAITASGDGMYAWALRSDATVWATGLRWVVSNGQAPRKIRGLAHITSISSEGYHNADQGGDSTGLARRANGTVWAWGQAGAFGSGEPTEFHAAQVTGVSRAVAVYGGSDYTAYAKVRA